MESKYEMDENHVLYTNADDRLPVFLSKLWTILESPEHSETVCWDESGFSFHIIDQFKFSRNVLPRYFKHSNLNSLVRQLNMYGFRKMTPLERSGGPGRNYEDQLEFSHPFFVRGRPDCLKLIKRKPSGKKESSNQGVGEDAGNGTPAQPMVKVPAKDLNAVLQEVKQLREKQNKMSERMAELSEQNETLWTEVGSVRAKHKKQEQIVNKLVQFLVALVNPSTSPSKRLAKRPMLAIEESVPTKQRRTSSSSSNNGQPFGINVGDNNNIHEILERLQREISSNDSHNVQNLSSHFSNSRNQGPVIAEMVENDDYELQQPPQQQPLKSTSPMNQQARQNIPPPAPYGTYAQVPRNQPKQPQQQQPQQQIATNRPAYRIVNPGPQQYNQNRQQIPVMRPPSNSTYVLPRQMPAQQPQMHQEVAIPSSQQLQLRNVPPAVQNDFNDLDMSDEYANFSEVIVPNGLHCEEPITFGSNVDPTLASELSEYLCGMDQQIDNCRGMIGNNWDNDEYDLGLDNMDYNPQQNQLMLEGPRSSEEPPTPQLLTPTGGSPANDAMMGHSLDH
uniref:HSF_DOMAIN domain-containing protein n=1 Tax=Steinernema glaseri TaxID=37863 RepID=A0A1I8AMQ7_9BILA